MFVLPGQHCLSSHGTLSLCSSTQPIPVGSTVCMEALKTIAKFQMATIEKWMGSDVPNIDDEDEMVMAMKAIKQVNPKISTYFYMESYTDLPLMTRMKTMEL